MNSEIEKYIIEHTEPEDELLQELNRETYAKVLHPRMISGHLQGKLLTSISKMIQPELAVEIGTFTGYAAICIARGLSESGKLHTIEVNDELVPFAKRYFQRAGLSEKIIQHTGDARDALQNIPENIDMVFIDGDKEQYVSYYQTVFPKVRKGGIILADNVLWSGKVVQEVTENDKFTKGILQFNAYVKNDSSVEQVIIPVRDGIMLIRKK
jgi:caffeoyl-CoA O-methyltransferase